MATVKVKVAETMAAPPTSPIPTLTGLHKNAGMALDTILIVSNEETILSQHQQQKLQNQRKPGQSHGD